jgi:hypothetical protein
VKKGLWSAGPCEIVAEEPMSEFKFACPVCGQHITADSSTSGGQIECPTCFQKIVVPQAPSSAETKFILSASQVAKPRPASAETGTSFGTVRRSPAGRAVPVIVALFLLLCAAGAALFVFRDRVLKLIRPQTHALAKLPANIVWSLDLKDAAFPETNVTGRIHGSAFAPERATLEGGNLSLRQGKGWPPDLGITILLPGRPGEDFAGKTFDITPDQPPPVPRLTLRWKDEQQQPRKQDFKGGYAMKLALGQPVRGRVPGQIYLCVSDENKSVVAGTFDATRRKPKSGPPKGKSPRPKG